MLTRFFRRNVTLNLPVENSESKTFPSLSYGPSDKHPLELLDDALEIL